MYGSGEVLGIMENKHGVQKGTKLKSAVFPQRFSLSWPMVYSAVQLTPGSGSLRRGLEHQNVSDKQAPLTASKSF